MANVENTNVLENENENVTLDAADDAVVEEVVTDDEEVVVEDDPMEDEVVEEKASGNIFKKIIALTTTGIAALFGLMTRIFRRGKKNDETTEAEASAEGTTTDSKSNLWTKIKNFFAPKDFTAGEAEIRNCGLSGALAMRCSKFISKLMKKLFKNAKVDENAENSRASVIQVIFKVLAVIASVAFAGVVAVYLVRLLPVILTAIAKLMAVALIIEIVFLVLGYATNTNVKCCE